MSGEVPGSERLDRGGCGATSGGGSNTRSSSSAAREPGIGGVVELGSGSLSDHGFV